ncbi:hypothetical protein EMMF5_006455 [Cystobasidiomycetes sp. EMM_F5]
MSGLDQSQVAPSSHDAAANWNSSGHFDNERSNSLHKDAQRAPIHLANISSHSAESSTRMSLLDDHDRGIEQQESPAISPTAMASDSADDRPLTISDVSASSPSVSPTLQPLNTQSLQPPPLSSVDLAAATVAPVAASENAIAASEQHAGLERVQSSLPRPPLNRAGTDPYPHTNASQSGTSSFRMSSQQANMFGSHQPPVAGPSRPPRYADPDTHWLSEDEGEQHTRDVTSRRRIPRSHRRHDGHDHDDFQDGHGSDKSGDASSKASALYNLLAGAHDVAQSHRGPRVSHKPATVHAQPEGLLASYARDYRANIQDASQVPRKLLASLRCPACRHIYQDPVTLRCGHSLCLACCAAPVRRRKNSNKDESLVAQTATDSTEQRLSRATGSRLGLERIKDDRNTAADTSHEIANEHSDATADTAEEARNSIGQPQPTAPKAHKVLLEDTLCKVSGCDTLTRAKGPHRDGYSIDYVLHKLTDIVRTYYTDDELIINYHAIDEIDAATLRYRHDVSSIPVGGGASRHSWDGGDVRSFTDASLMVSGEGDSPSPQSSVSSIEDTPKSDSDLLKRSMGRRKGQPKMSKRAKAEKDTPRQFAGALTSKSKPFSINEDRKMHMRELPMEAKPSDLPAEPYLPTLVLDTLSELECQGFNYFLSSPFNQTLVKLVTSCFPALYAERKMLIKQEEDAVGLDTPLFICMVSFPTLATNLHIYEPRYRLMMRRAMDNNRRFGMLLPSRANGGVAQYGTMLEIQNLHLFEDGRSIVESVGVHRFKVLESGTLDGYTVGRIERIEDIDDEQEDELERLAMIRNEARRAARATAESVESVKSSSSQANAASGTAAVPSSPLPAAHGAPMARTDSSQNAAFDNEASGAEFELSNKELVNQCRGFVEALRTGSTPWLIQRLNDTLPPMPEDPRDLTWWMATLMPVDDHEKARLLQITSYRLRLRLIVHWIQQMQNSWWFTRGCTIC